jgi:hypothetical protein
MRHPPLKLRPKEKIMAENGTVAYMNELPPCDICRLFPDEGDSAVPPRTAAYDFKTQQGPWANACQTHYEKFRLYDDLGLGKGQKLVARPKPELQQNGS